jgi:class 3 adenylate cyclase
MHQIADWLKKLGLPEYGERFAENGIDVSVLPHLTDQDFKDMGVLLGRRRKMLAAIRELSSQPAAARAPATDTPIGAAAIPTASPISPAAEAASERRYLTVMFCDLVDSTGIAARLDAEEWRDLVKAYLDDASAVVMEMGGHVARKIVDGLLALFGYPLAHENDAERASRAALSIQRALVDLNRKNAGVGKPELKARIGLETGPVVVDATGEVYGDVPNTAARVQALAEPSAVLMTAQVQRQVAGLFVVEERGRHQLKGVPERVTLFRLIRASGGGRRSGVRQLTPFVGREEENGDADAALGAGAAGRGTTRVDRRRPGARQVSSD